jgi:hypothetical protein
MVAVDTIEGMASHVTQRDSGETPNCKRPTDARYVPTWQPEQERVHDFLIPELGKLAAY